MAVAGVVIILVATEVATVVEDLVALYVGVAMHNAEQDRMEVWLSLNGLLLDQQEIIFFHLFISFLFKTISQ